MTPTGVVLSFSFLIHSVLGLQDKLALQKAAAEPKNGAAKGLSPAGGHIDLQVDQVIQAENKTKDYTFQHSMSEHTKMYAPCVSSWAVSWLCQDCNAKHSQQVLTSASFVQTILQAASQHVSISKMYGGGHRLLLPVVMKKSQTSLKKRTLSQGGCCFGKCDRI